MAAVKKDPQEDVVKLNNVISNGAFKHVHLLYGAEDYLLNQFKDKLIKALTGDSASMNFDKFTGKETNAGTVIDIAETMPFFADRRVILIEDSGWFKNGNDAMAEYIADGICDTTFIVFCEKEVDKRSKMYKAADSAGMISEFMEQTEATLASWVSKQIKNAGLQISGADIRYLLTIVGTDMVNISNEIEKLVCYSMNNGTINKADIDAICSRRLEDKIFEMCDALALRRKQQAFAMYYDLISLRESPVKIMNLITRQYNLLMQIKDMEMNRRSDAQIGEAIGRPAWTIKNYRAQTSHYTLKELKTIVNDCAQLDMEMKSGQSDFNVGVEMLLVKLCMQQ